MRGSPDLEFITKTSGMVSPILPDASSVYLLQCCLLVLNSVTSTPQCIRPPEKMFVLTMSSQYTPPQCIPAVPACFFPPTAQLPPLTADVEYCLRHLRGDIHNNGAVLQPLDTLALVEQEVGQGRVEELPFLGIHREGSNIDAL